MKMMEREVCLQMALLEENEPLLTVQTKQRGDTRTHPHARRFEQLRSALAAKTETRVFEALRVTCSRGRLWGCNAR